VAIEFRCPCGAASSAAESQSGKMFTCPTCGFQIKVPMPKPVDDPNRQEVVGEMINQVADVTGAASRMKADREDALKNLLGEDTLSQIRAESKQLRQAIGETVGVSVPVEPPAGSATAAFPSGEASSAVVPAASDAAPGAAVGEAAPGAGAAEGAAAPDARPAGGRSPLTRRLTVPPTEKPEEQKKAWGPPPKGLERAAHHLAFKRIMWGPVLLIALTCAGFAVWCFLPHDRPVGKVPINEDAPEFKEVPAIVGDAKDEMWAIPRRTTPIQREDGMVAYKDDKGQEVVGRKIWLDLSGRYWAVPAGREPYITKNGTMVYDYTAAEMAGTDENDPQLKALPAIVRNAKDDMWAIPRGTAPVMCDDGTVAYKADTGEEVPGKKLWLDQSGVYWAVPAGRQPTITKNGIMVYNDDSGFEQLAEPADSWVRRPAESAHNAVSLYNQIQKQKDYLVVHGSEGESTRSTYRLFAICFSVVAAVLLALGVWLWHDVWIVRRATADQAGEESETGAAEEAGASAAPGAAQASAAPAGAPAAPKTQASAAADVQPASAPASPPTDTPPAGDSANKV